MPPKRPRDDAAERPRRGPPLPGYHDWSICDAAISSCEKCPPPDESSVSLHSSSLGRIGDLSAFRPADAPPPVDDASLCCIGVVRDVAHIRFGSASSNKGHTISLSGRIGAGFLDLVDPASGALVASRRLPGGGVWRSLTEIHKSPASSLRISASLLIESPLRFAFTLSFHLDAAHCPSPSLYRIALDLHPSLNTVEITDDMCTEDENTALERPLSDMSSEGAALVDPAGLECELLPFQRRAVAWMLQRERGEAPPIVTSAWQAVPGTDGRVWVDRMLTRVCASRDPPVDIFTPVRGGILAEEMGLGKTVEIIALILARRQECIEQAQKDNLLVEKGAEDALENVHTTLIIAPATIMHQWQSELQSNAPTLSVLVYDGIRRGVCPLSVAELRDADIILTSYEVLRNEYHFVNVARGRPQRTPKVYEHPKSPLTLVRFARVCLDEAQMVETTTSNIADLARRLNAAHRWAVTGTPYGPHGLDDVAGLTLFLRQEPLDGLSNWRNLTGIQRRRLLDHVRAHVWRSSKRLVSNEVALSPPTHLTVRVRLSQVETYNYNRVLERLVTASASLHASASDHDGSAPLDTSFASQLLQLRQACCHPQLGTFGHRTFGAFGHRTFGAATRSMAEVLDVLLAQARAHAGQLGRAVCANLIRQGVMMELEKEFDGALRMYAEARRQADAAIEQVQKNIAEAEAQQEEEEENDDDDSDDDDVIDDADDEGVAKSKRREHGDALRSWLEVKHTVMFNTASVFLHRADDATKETETGENIKIENVIGGVSNGEQARGADMSSAMDIDTHIDDVSKANVAGKSGVSDDVSSSARVVSSSNTSTSTTSTSNSTAISAILPIECALSIDATENKSIADALFDQAEKIRGDIMRVVTSITSRRLSQLATCVSPTATTLDLPAALALVAKDERELYVDASSFPSALTMSEELADLSRLFGSLNANLAELCRARASLYEQLTSELQVDYGDDAERQANVGAAIESHQKLLAKRRALVGHASASGGARDLRGLYRLIVQRAAQLRDTNSKEGAFLSHTATRLYAVIDAQIAALRRLDTEAARLRHVDNSRILYYRQLQRLSDQVAMPENVASPNEESRQLRGQLARLETDLTAARGRLAYLSHLNGGAAQPRTQETCVVCTQDIVTGVLTPCGHAFCEDCLERWMRRHASCPVCKAPVRHSAVLKWQRDGPRVLGGGENEEIGEAEHPGLDSSVAIVRRVSSKIDAVLRLVVHLNSASAEAKTLVFSQWDDLLRLVDDSLRENGVRAVRLGGVGSGAERSKLVHAFRTDPEIKVLLLSARTQSSGLTLVGATHVVLMEPLVNGALERQAVGRVHRIGQKKKTYVHRFVAVDTVEESIEEMTARSGARGQGEEEGGKREKAVADNVTLDQFRSIMWAQQSAREV